MQGFAQSGFSFERVAATAVHVDFFILRMDVSFHFFFLAKVGRGGCTRTEYGIRARIIHEIEGLCNFHFILNRDSISEYASNGFQQDG